MTLEETQTNPQRQNPCELGPIPQDPTARLDDPLDSVRFPRVIPKESAVLTHSALLAHLMVNVPHSEAPSPKNIRLGNDE